MKKITKWLLITTLPASVLVSTTILSVSCTQNAVHQNEKQMNLNKAQQESIKEFANLNQEIIQADLIQFKNDLLTYLNTTKVSTSNQVEINNLNFNELNKTISFNLKLNFIFNNKTYNVLIEYQNIKIEPILVEHNFQVINSWKISGNQKSKIISQITVNNTTSTKNNSQFTILNSNFYNQFNYKLFFNNIISENENLGLFYINTSSNSKQLSSADLLPTPTKIEEIFTVDDNLDQPEDNKPIKPVEPEEKPVEPEEKPTQPEQNPLPPTQPNNNSNTTDNTHYIGPELALEAYRQLFNTKMSLENFKSDLNLFQSQLNSYLIATMTNYKFNTSELNGELQQDLSTFVVTFKNINQIENQNKKYYNFELEFNCKIVLKNAWNQIHTNNITLNIKYDKIALLPIVIKKGRSTVAGGYKLLTFANSIKITRTINNKTTSKIMSTRLNDMKVYPEYSQQSFNQSFVQHIFNNNAKNKLSFWMESQAIKKQFSSVQKIPNKLDDPLK